MNENNDHIDLRETSTNVRDGLDPVTKRFLPGNKMGKGNPFAAEMAKFRAALFRSIKEGDIEAITAKQIEKASEGDTKSATLIYELIGLKVKQSEVKIEGEGNMKLYVGLETDQV